MVPGQTAVVPIAPSRERILKVAKTLFVKNGYEHAATSAIARAAGTSESQLIKHFGNKHGLLEAIFVAGWDEVAAEARSAIQDLTAPVEKLRVLTQTVLAALDRDPEFKLLLLLEGRRVRKEGQAISLTTAFLSFVHLIDSILKEAQETGAMRRSLPPQAVRSALMGMLEGMVRDQLLAERSGYPAEYDSSAIRHVLSLALGSFMVQPDKAAP